MPRYDALPTNLPPRGLNREAAAQYIGVSPVKFDELVVDGRMPKAVQIDGRKVWDRHALDKSFDALADTMAALNPWDKIFSAVPPQPNKQGQVKKNNMRYDLDSGKEKYITDDKKIAESNFD